MKTLYKVTYLKTFVNGPLKDISVNESMHFATLDAAQEFMEWIYLRTGVEVTVSVNERTEHTIMDAALTEVFI